MNEKCIAEYVAQRLRQLEQRIQERRLEKQLKDARHAACAVHCQRQSVEQARRREQLKRLCGAMTRAGHPCKRKGVGRGGRCLNHGGASTGPKTAEGRLRIAAAQQLRWAIVRNLQGGS